MFTQVVDYITKSLTRKLGSPLIFDLIDLLVLAGAAGAFAVFGYFARQGVRWVFVLGMVLYALDLGLTLLGQDWPGALFHCWALFWLWRGQRAISQLRALDQG